MAPPPDFPVAVSDSIHKRLSLGHVSLLNPEAFRQFAGGWNGLLARFTLCAESAEEFQRMIADPASLSSQRARYEQDRALFCFFVGGGAAIECLHFAIFALGGLAKPSSFSLPERDVTPKACAKAFREAYPEEPLTLALAELQNDGLLWKWFEIRNILAHRMSPGWNQYVGGEDERIEWLNIPLDGTTTAERRKWLIDWVVRILAVSDEFAAKHLS
jgi:hypothetical protein